MIRRGGVRRLLSTCMALIGGVSLLSGCTKPPPRSEIASGQLELNRLLAGADTEEQLTERAGMPPRVCLPASPSARLCEWQLGNRDPGWKPLARTIPTRDRINLLCLIPAQGGRRAPDSCAVFPQRSNRYRYALSKNGPDPKARQVRQQQEARYQRETTAQIAGAVTLMDLASLMGEAPDACVEHGEGMRVCTWLATGRSYGQGTLAFSVLAPVREKVQLQCLLPADGSPRASGSCRVEVPGHEYSGLR